MILLVLPVNLFAGGVLADDGDAADSFGLLAHRIRDGFLQAEVAVEIALAEAFGAGFGFGRFERDHV